MLGFHNNTDVAVNKENDSNKTLISQIIPQGQN